MKHLLSHRVRIFTRRVRDRSGHELAEKQSTSIPFECPHCHANLKMSAKQAGQVGKCSSCHEWIETPVLAAIQRGVTIGKKATPGQNQPRPIDEVFSFKCQLCGTLLSSKPDQAGNAIRCPDCNTRNTIPAPPRKLTQPKAELSDAVYRLHEGTGQPNATASEIAVVCSLCGTRVYAKHQQIGKHIRCPDCGTTTLVKAAPKAQQRKFAPVVEGPLYGVSAPVEVTAPRESADGVMDKAKLRVEEIEKQLPKPPARPLLDGVYTYPFYPQSLVIIAILTLVQFVVIILMRELMLAGLSPFMVPVAAVTSLLAVVVYMVTAMVYLTVLEQTANCNDKIEVWPDFGIFDWLFHSLFIFNSFILSFLPGALVEMLICMITGGLWTIVIGGLISMFFLFPLILISMMVENSRVQPYSSAVWASVRKIWKPWLVVYGVSAAMTGILGAVMSFLPLMDDLVWPIAVVVLILVIEQMVYFRLLGRVAWVVGNQLR